MKKFTNEQIFEFLMLISEELKVFIPFSKRMEIYRLYKETYSEKSTPNIRLPKYILKGIKESDIKDFENKYGLMVLNSYNYDFIMFLDFDNFFTFLKLKGK